MQKVSFFALASLVLVTSCAKENTNEPSDERVALAVTADIAKQTRAENASWVSGDAIGIFMLDGATALETNRQYITTGNGTFSPATGQTIYYPMGDGQTVDFIAYYPHKNTQSDFSYPIDVTDQSNQKALDLMTSAKVTGKSYTSPAVVFTFAHRMSRLNFTLAPGDGLTAADLAGITVTISDLHQTGVYNFNTGALTASGSATDLDMLIIANGTCAQATILPSAAASREFTFTLSSGEVFRLELADFAFEAGSKYLYTITLKRTAATITATITDWATEIGWGVAN